MTVVMVVLATVAAAVHDALGADQSGPRLELFLRRTAQRLLSFAWRVFVRAGWLPPLLLFLLAAAGHLQHNLYPMAAVQFHPESIMTSYDSAMRMMNNAMTKLVAAPWPA